jgi:hypothetical protein
MTEIPANAKPLIDTNCHATAAAPDDHYRQAPGTFGHVCTKQGGHDGLHACACGTLWGTMPVVIESGPYTPPIVVEQRWTPPAKPWLTRDEFEAMPAEELNAWFEANHIDVRVMD